MAQWEREEISERIAATVPIRAKLGKSLGGPAQFGYKWHGKKLIIDANETPVRRLMFELFLEHKRVKTTCRILNERGYRTRRGNKWTDSTVHRLLTDTLGKGLRRANFSKAAGDGVNWVEKPESEWIYSQVDPIVDEEMWNIVNSILAKQKASKKKRARRPVHLFSGLVYCKCGKKMYVPSSSPKYTCSGCRNKIRIEDLEAVLHNQLKPFS